MTVAGNGNAGDEVARQRALVASLADALGAQMGTAVTRIETHISHVLVAGDSAWKGEIPLDDDGWARALRTGAATVRGEAIYQMEKVTVKAVRDPIAEMLKQDARIELRAIEAMPKNERGNDYPKVRRCARHAPTKARQVLVKLRLTQIRLELGETGYYVVSTLPSARARSSSSALVSPPR